MELLSSQFDAQIKDLRYKLSQLDEDVEVVIVLTRNQMQLPLESMIENLNPNFEDARLLPRSRLKELQIKAQVSINKKFSIISYWYIENNS